ncbi:ABC transporter permease [Rhodococcus globerulus]|uniref:ABC transporter permease n=1 Tax=Rhodococcus globerulus TaxID=33008 RepID=UPI000E39894C
MVDRSELRVPETEFAARTPIRPAFLPQWLTLTERSLRSMVAEGEFVSAVVAPLVFALGFYLPLRIVMEDRGLDYAQFLMPIIVLQAMTFTALSAAQRSAMDSVRGMSKRLQTMPVGPLTPLAARMSVALVRSAVSLFASIVYGYVLGFRFVGPSANILYFCAFALVFSLVLSLGADAIGLLSKSPEASGQALVLPQMILGMLSTGFVPESGFPEWARPFARNQPISHFSAAMRDMATGTLTWPTLAPALLWAAGLAAVFVPLALWAGARRS